MSIVKMWTYTCDNCGAKKDVLQGLVGGGRHNWVELTISAGGTRTERHFCCPACFAEWATKRAGEVK